MHSGETDRLDWELATESIVVKIRWFGILMGVILIEARSGLHNPSAVRTFLMLGAGYAALDTVYYRLGAVFLRRFPLGVSLMESVFITLLCFNDTQLQSPFRWYYLLSIICCAIRYPRLFAWTTCGLHCLSFALLAWSLGVDRPGMASVIETVVILACVAWASSSLASVLNATGARLEGLNRELVRHRADLEVRVAERTAALRASQARVIQQEKMAAFGLLAAGIAHEVGNPLAGISSLIQIIRRHHPDRYTDTKLELVESQLARIQRIIRDLIDFSRPASTVRGRVRPLEVVEEALGIAKYYQRTKERAITTNVPPGLAPVRGVRDHLTQVILNLVLNAIDATGRGGRIHLEGREEAGAIILSVEDDGRGISLDDRSRLFQPYFTTKPSGTGLGLFVSRQIVEEMGGQLTFRSEPGQGATFLIHLPADRPEPTARPARPALAEEVAG
ncbi:sensor histidine kinase [Tundrisphaera lichenicola]|uniref:sensor histidine kinase n=1 Tax=Tundrisphaera lichenicola TaxID=2029860 RepID=UPI003EC14609